MRVHESFRWRSVQDRARHCKRLMVEHSFDFLKHVNWKFVVCEHHDKRGCRDGKDKGGAEIVRCCILEYGH